MDKPLCPQCGKGMYAGIPVSHPSDGVQITELQCFSMNSHHKILIEEPIPDWNKFSMKREELIPPNARRMSERTQQRILSLLAKGIPYPEIAQKTGFSTSIICRLKQVTLLAAMGAALSRR